MTDAELQAKYPLPPEMQELTETMLNGGKPVARPAAMGVEQMQVILKKLREDQRKTINSMEEFSTNEALVATLANDLKALKLEIAYYEQRLQEYATQQSGLN
jgi:hypothetical protein